MQPTLARFENAISIKCLKRLRDVLIDQFIASFDAPPRHLTFDLDAVDDPAHGCQQLTFWHAYYAQNVPHEACRGKGRRAARRPPVTLSPVQAGGKPLGRSCGWMQARGETAAPE